MKVYLVYHILWRDSDDWDAIAYEVEKIFNTKEKAENYLKENYIQESEECYIEEREIY